MMKGAAQSSGLANLPVLEGRDPDERLSDVLDSLAFIDLFLLLEEHAGGGVALDDLVRCKTVGELNAFIARTSRQV